MPTVKQQKHVPYPADVMYTLVDNIEAYPEFLPWCNQAHILSRDLDEVRATLHLSAGGFHKSFSTCNRLQKNKMIEIRLIDGPFKHLEGFWRFESDGDTQSVITLDLEFEFSNKLLGFAFGPAFNQVTTTLMDAFCQRADALYKQQDQ